MPFDGESLIPIVADVISDFGANGEIELWETGSVDPISGEVLVQPTRKPVVYVIDTEPSIPDPSGKVESGDAIATLQADFIIKESYRLIDVDGVSWAIITATPVKLQDNILVWDLQIRK